MSAAHAPAFRHVSVVVHALKVDIKAPEAADVLEYLVGRVVERTILMLYMPQREGAISTEIHVPHLNVRLAAREILRPRDA